MKKITLLTTTLAVSLVMSNKGNTEAFEKCVSQETLDQNVMLCTSGVSKWLTIIYDDIVRCQDTPNTPHGIYCTYVE